MKLFFYTVLIAILSINSLSAQDFTALVEQAWKSNNALKSKDFNLQSAENALLEAKSMFGPSLTFGLQYSLAAGGRSIDFPVGDLLNPVYSTLNQVTNTNSFPQIENVTTTFLPNNFYDARFRVSQPIYYPDLTINRKLKEETIQYKNLEIKAHKRQISKDVMTGYFQYKTSSDAIEIYDAALSLLQEAYRSTQSMIKNGIALPSAASRIESQQALMTANKIEATSNYHNATRYLQFILGSDDVSMVVPIPELPTLDLNANHTREELSQIDQGIKMQNLAYQKEDQFYLPRLGAQIDVGSQAFDFGFTPYVLAGLNVEVNLFDNKRHNHRKNMVKSDIMAAEYQKQEVAQQINLQVAVSKENLISAIDQAKTFKPRISAAQKVYDEVFRKYKEGTTNYLELIDAQTQVTQVNLQYLLAQNNAWLKWADYIYSTASLNIQ